MPTRSKTRRQLEAEVQGALSSGGTESAQADDVSEYLSVYLGDPGTVPGIGSERGKRPASGVGRYKSPHGSVRYVWYEGGSPLSALQVVTRDGKTATIANVYTAAGRRRQGLAARLLARARRDFDRVEHAREEHLSPAGHAWSARLG